jgi:hypothetical protein
MFTNAYEIVTKFTYPIIIFSRNNSGECFAGIGSMVFINSEGWAVTAAHIIQELNKSTSAERLFQEIDAKKKQIYAASLDKKERAKQLKALPQFDAKSITNVSALWGFLGLMPEKIHIVQGIDLAFIKFQKFDLSIINLFPTFKDYTKNIKHGKSLCRVGFPFSSITPRYDANTNNFILPNGSLPLPFFPNDGIFTRNVIVLPDPKIKQPSFRMMYLETSSPGLKGQSGGPIFDSNGYIWGIQSVTQHYPLGFNPPVPNSKNNEKEHQFMNVGWGVHVETIICAMMELGIQYNSSSE